MKMNVIPVNENTIDLIETLNNGVRPEFEPENTFFVWKKDEPAEIITLDTMTGISEWWTIIPTYYLNP